MRCPVGRQVNFSEKAIQLHGANYYGQNVHKLKRQFRPPTACSKSLIIPIIIDHKRIN